MTSPIRVGYFLEDIAHAQFVTAVVQRVAESLHLSVTHDVRNASGGRGRVMHELRNYLRDMCAGHIEMAPLIVVAIDGNCSRWQQRRREILDMALSAGYAGNVVCAVPSPHIERWYLADLDAFRSAVPGSNPPQLPSRKCERGYYKKALMDAFRATGVIPQLGGAEYARDIVARMRFEKAARRDPAFSRFVGDLSGALKACR
ncbi:MAG: DUF4276 family protein [Anaerolineae bacterium]|nr:DUF4276 family protein [Anaerolineae bacterium]